MGNRFKRPAGKTSPRLQPQDPPRVSSNDQKPIFNLEHLKGAYCLSECSTEQKAAFADRIWRLSRLTWGEIQRAHRHGLGAEEIARESPGMDSFPPELSPDQAILAFRFMGMGPFPRLPGVFTVLIVDPKMTAYDHR